MNESIAPFIWVRPQGKAVLEVVEELDFVKFPQRLGGFLVIDSHVKYRKNPVCRQHRYRKPQSNHTTVDIGELSVQSPRES